MKKYRIKLKTITPVHIGNGEESRAVFEFIEKIDLNSENREKKVIKIDLMEMLKGVNDKEMAKEFANNILKLEERKGNKNQNKPTRQISDHQMRVMEWNKVINKLKNSLEENGEMVFEECVNVCDLRGTVKFMVKNQYGAYIPGSTLKGAILNPFIYKNLEEREIMRIAENARISGRKKSIKRDKDKKYKEKPEIEELREKILFRDSSIVKKEDVDFYSVSRSGKKIDGSIDQILECIKPETEIEFDIISRIKGNEIERIIEDASKFYKKVMEKEKQYKVKNESCNKLLLIGFGTGVYSKCIFGAVKENIIRESEDFSPTYWITKKGNMPMGLVDVVDIKKI